jgi:hypothetical protein
MWGWRYISSQTRAFRSHYLTIVGRYARIPAGCAWYIEATLRRGYAIKRSLYSEMTLLRDQELMSQPAEDQNGPSEGTRKSLLQSMALW